jgi:UDPglucose 6-dehydrogenase
MKVAILGKTLFSGVMAGLLAECGHQVLWCNRFAADEPAQHYLQDESLRLLLDKQQQLGFLNDCDFQQLDFNQEVFFFSFNPAEEQLALQVMDTLGHACFAHPKLMINASTWRLQATRRFQQILPNDDWVYLPDIIQEGNAIHSFAQATQLIVGCDQADVQLKIRELLRPLFPRAQQYLFMPILDAEFTKLSISGMLATRISYMNDLASVAEKLGIDIEQVRQGMAADNRIGPAYLFPGVGFGGENFSHDIRTLTHAVAESGVKSQLLEQVWDINEQQKELLFRKLWNYFRGDLRGKVVALWGAAFKENTPSIQQSPVHAMLQALWAQGVIVKLHDPQALANIEQRYGPREDLILCEEQYQATENADALCVLTAWKQYSSPDYAYLLKLMQHPLILDGRNLYDPAYTKARGFNYMGVGR